MKNTQIKTICRLAVVAKDFSTYYIPGVTVISDKKVNQIALIGEEYQVLDAEGQLLATVHKSAPCVVDYTEVFEMIDLEWLNSDEVQQILIQFGNYLFDQYKVLATNSKGEPAYNRQVTDADLRNFESTFFAESLES